MNDLKKIQLNLFNKLQLDWQQALRFFVKSQDFTDILQALQEDVEDGYRFTPALKHVFKPFETLSPDQVRVVFLSPSAHPNPLNNSGLAFSRKPTPMEPFPSMWLKKLDPTYSDEQVLSGNMESWAQQGILLLNTSLTTRVGKFAGHFTLWNPFIQYVLQVLNKKDIIFVEFGNSKVMTSINDKHTKFSVGPWPMEKNEEFKDGWIFQEVNNVLESKGLNKILW